MILYLDTSAFVRLYISEAGHDLIWQAARAASQIATHVIAYPEMRAALAKMRRMGRLNDEELGTAKKLFELDWQTTLRITPTEAMMRRAGELAERFSLRGYDSVHLAAAESLLVAAPGTMRFACFDRDLNKAAAEIGIPLLEGT